jgi:VWFA-related protein
MYTRLLAALLLAFSQQTGQPPTIRSGVNLVEVDVVVTDKAGLPIRGLRQQDFEVLEDGKPVGIVAFSAIDLPLASPDEKIPVLDRSGASISTNDQPDDGRVLLIVLDDYHIRFDAGFAARTRTIARRLVERLGPSDQAAVIATSGRNTMQAEFTTDKARLVDAIDRFFPQAEPHSSLDAARIPPASASGMRSNANFEFVREIKGRWAADAMSSASKALAQIPHRRKAMLFVSEGLPVNVEDLMTNPYAAGAWSALRDFLLTAQRSNVAVYPFDPCGLGLECSTKAQENLRVLAHHTGGFAVVNTNAPEAAIDRMVAENGTYYLLGYESPAAPNDGRRHRITVRTRVPDVDVRARTEYTSARRGRTSEPAQTPLDGLIGAPIQTRGLRLRLAGVPAPFAASPGGTVHIAIEIAAADALAAKTVDFDVAAIDNGRVSRRQRFTNTFEGRTATGWARINTHLPLKEGRYQLRVAAVAANKIQGSVFTEIAVPNFDGALVLGGLTLVSPAGGAVANVAHMSQAIDLHPIANRVLPFGTPSIAAVAIRMRPKSAVGTLSIASTLEHPDGSRHAIERVEHPATDFSALSGKVHRISIPPNLGTGSYRLVVEATSGAMRATRSLSFQIAAAD